MKTYATRLAGALRPLPFPLGVAAVAVALEKIFSGMFGLRSMKKTYLVAEADAERRPDRMEQLRRKGIEKGLQREDRSLCVAGLE